MVFLKVFSSFIRRSRTFFPKFKNNAGKFFRSHVPKMGTYGSKRLTNDTMRFQGPELWNSLPSHLGECERLCHFKKQIRIFIMKQQSINLLPYILLFLFCKFDYLWGLGWHHHFITIIISLYSLCVLMLNITIFLVLWFRLFHFKPGQFNSFHFWLICFPFKFSN